MDDRGSLALRAGQDNVHKVTRPRHRLDLFKIIYHHGCWLSWDVCNGRKSEGRVGIHALFWRSSSPVCLVCGGWTRRAWRRKIQPQATVPYSAAKHTSPVRYDAVVVMVVASCEREAYMVLSNSHWWLPLRRPYRIQPPLTHTLIQAHARLSLAICSRRSLADSIHCDSGACVCALPLMTNHSFSFVCLAHSLTSSSTSINITRQKQQQRQRKALLERPGLGKGPGQGGRQPPI